MSNPDSHAYIGKALGSSEVSEEGRLHEKLVDDAHDAWDGDGFKLDFLKQIYIAVRKKGLPIKIFKRTLEDNRQAALEEWREDEDVRKALEEHPGRKKGRGAAGKAKRAREAARGKKPVIKGRSLLRRKRRQKAGK